ncbi:MAG: nucleoside hydrolase [Actinobacteria bacterium]|nr:nucleoside hydrolase [Actinomycetota bacterium]
MTRRIVIDTDPGQDDAVALLLALASPELEVAAVTAVAGNVPLSRTSVNARVVCELAGRPDVPVYAGCDRPLRREPYTAEYVHGPTGLDGADLPEPVMPLADGHAVDALARLLTAAEPASVTLCTLGPLTNVATLLRDHPGAGRGLAGIVAMGGGFFEGGNTTPAAEFNIYVDPEAADIVFRSGLPLTLFPLDATHQVLILDDHLRRLRALGRVGRAVAGWLEFYERWDVAKYGFEGGPLHDPCVIAYLLAPGLFGGKDCNVQIEVESPLTVGMTVVDWWGVTGDPANCHVVRDVDAEGFFDLLIERLGRL